MTDLDQAPTRLLDDPNLGLGLRRDLELAREHSPIRYDVDAGLARFEQSLLDAGAGASTVPPGGSVTGLKVLGWFVGAAALVGGIGYLASSAGPGPGELDDPVARVTSTAEPEVRPERAPVVVQRPSGTQTQPLRSGSGEWVAEPEGNGGAGGIGVTSSPPNGGSPVLTPSAPRPTSKSKPSGSDTAAGSEQPAVAGSLTNEAAQINAARKALAGGDPSEALALMQAAEQSYPQGAMVEERRGYTILALVALGRREDAEQRADTYLKRWPNGTLSRRVRDALGR